MNCTTDKKEKTKKTTDIDYEKHSKRPLLKGFRMKNLIIAIKQDTLNNTHEYLSQD